MDDIAQLQKSCDPAADGCHPIGNLLESNQDNSKTMFLKIWQFITLVLAGLYLSLGSAHVLELPSKLRYDGQMYAAVNTTLYPLFATVGAFYTIGSILSAAVLTFLVRKRPSFGLTLAGTLCLAMAFGGWIMVVAPVNAEWLQIIQSTPAAVPEAYLRLRNQWEYGHAAAFVATLIGFSLLVLSILQEGPANSSR